jgi:serine/threonine-protein phosphatase 6 regulatory ankyrin repeat subunit A
MLTSQHLGIDRLPQELLLQIFSYLGVSGLFPLKLAGNRYLTTVINSLPRPSFFNYVQELHSANPGYHPIQIAVTRGHEALLIALFKDHGVDMVYNETSVNYGKSKLHWAADIGRNQTVKRLLLEGARLDSKDSSMRTPLHWAAANGHEETVKLLLESRTFLWAVKNGKKARYIKRDFSREVAAFDTSKKTPLYLAAKNGHEGTVRLLLKMGGRGINGANIGSASHSVRHEKNALDLAAENGHVEVVRLLLSSPDRFCNDSWTRRHVSRKALYWTAKKGQLATAKLLLDELASITPSKIYPLQVSEDKDGQDAVIAAVENGQKEMVKLLLERKVKVPRGILEVAAEKKQLAILSVLLDWGLHNGGYGGEEKAVLLWAASNGDVETVRFILSHEIDEYKEATDKCGRTALHCAASAEIDLIWNGAWPFSDPRGYRHGHTQVVKYLLLHGEVDIEAKDNFLMTALHHAAVGDRKRSNTTGPPFGVPKQIIKLLLDHGADRSAKDSYGRLPLHCAAANGDTEIFSLLLQQKSDIDAKDKKGKTPLHYAAKGFSPVWNCYKVGHMSMVEFLLDEGADKDAQDNDGRTPMHFAAMSGLEYIVDLLRDRGASSFIKDNSGLTAPHLLALWKAEQIRKANAPSWISHHGEGNGGIGGGCG